MKRTKAWWAALTKEERSELHHLEYANSLWQHRGDKGRLKCNYCNENSHSHNWERLCPKCLKKLNQLIQKANNAT